MKGVRGGGGGGGGGVEGERGGRREGVVRQEGTYLQATILEHKQYIYVL